MPVTWTVGTILFLTAMLVPPKAAEHPASVRCDRYPTEDAVVSISVPVILAPLLTRWRGALRVADPMLTIASAAPAPPQGALDPALAAFLDGKRDAAFLTREIAEADLDRFRRAHGNDLVVIPVAGGSPDRFGYVDPVVVIVNAANPIRVLDLAQVDAIFSTTRLRGAAPIDEWGAAGVSAWRGRPIRLVGGGAWAGAESARALTMRRRVLSVAGHVGRWRGAPGSGDESDNVERVARDPLAIGFTGAGHVLPGTRVVGLASRRGAAPVLPTRTAIAAGRYPLVRSVDLLVARAPDGTIACRVKRLARFLIAPEGQRIVAEDGVFLPLTPVQRRAARARIGRRD